MEITTIQPFLDYFERIRGRTMRVAACIPDPHIEWRPRDGAFSFGDLLRHLAAMERWMFAENVVGRQTRYQGCGPDLASGKTDVMAFVETCHRDAVDIFRTLSPEQLQQRCPQPGGSSMPAWKWLRAMVEHEVHHRGQIYLMLGLLGVATPPLYGLTAEQVQGFSIGG